MTENLLWEQQHGSGFAHLLGYQLSEWSPGLAVVEMTLRPEHLNRAGLPHGGLLTTLLDTACGYAGCYCPIPGHIRRTLTLSLTTNYIGQARSGSVCAVARVIGGGRKIFFTSAELFDGKPDQVKANLIASATGTFRYHRGSEDERGQPRTED
jgi:uncharacterized protein (TIGR00369 family)